MPKHFQIRRVEGHDHGGDVLRVGRGGIVVVRAACGEFGSTVNGSGVTTAS
jgi:hypothetical protein